MTSPFPLYEFGGSGPVLNLAPANGFPPETYRPLLEPLAANYRVISLVPRAMWSGQPPPAHLVAWPEMVVDDLLAALRRHDLRDVIGVGHSLGGVMTLLAAGIEPERFRAVVLLDPPLLPRRKRWPIRWIQQLRLDRLNRLAVRASNRRDRFPDEQTAFNYFRGKPLFSDWSDEALLHYTRTLRPGSNGGLTLAWPRDWEAYYFRTLYTGVWAHLTQIPASLPVLLLRGEHSNTLSPVAVERARRLLPHLCCAEIAGHGHLFPQSAPDLTRQQIAGWLASLPA